jgi:hypothetical protein
MVADSAGAAAVPSGEAAESLAVGALNWLLGSARGTGDGLAWAAAAPGAEANFSLYHGAAGIVLALLEAQQHFGDDRYGDAATRGATAIAVAAGHEENCSLYFGFVVPHSDPQHRPDLIERYSYGWCNGPAGDAQAFRLLGAVTGDAAWAALADRCWHTVTHCGLPRRIRPGFRDNSGRCCGTAGVLALACDRHVEQAEDLGFAGVLVADLAARANAAVAARAASASTGSTAPGSTGSGTGQVIIRLFTAQEFASSLSRQLHRRERAAQSP